MIVLKILLYILLAVLGIILLVLITPAGGEFSYIDGKFSYKVKLWVLNLTDSEGGGIYGWWKKRRAKKKEKPEKPKKPKKIKEKKQKKKKERDKYEWEEELDSIPVNDPGSDMQSAAAAETSSETAGSGTHEAVPDSSEEEPKKKKDRKKKDDTDEDIFAEEAAPESGDDDEEKKSLSDKIEFLVGIWESAQRPMLKIFKGFRLKDLYIDFVIADEDAYDCALKYGKYSTLVYNGIAFFSQLFTVRLKTIDVRPQFGVSKGRWDAAGKLYFRLGTVVIAGAWFLITYLFRTFLPEKLRKFRMKRKMKKSAARQK
ncbi:MAG: hypothetical protein IKW96_09915 [Ruminococcus sp.]|uniref:hypothetical protein n=1 Tax=Ruminococcus sp. TaxID=41978 RepID=UPI0025EC0502|nr:hypothetical protein [Ruminococcus sp.]MBR5683568.1 hypothetical protein [Ruminococcus sp.]